MNDLVEFLIFIIILFAVVVGIFFVLIVGVDYLDCKGFKAGTGFETKWEWGCYAKVDGKWIPKKYVFGDVNEVRIK